MQDRWTSQIESITAEYQQDFGTLTREELNWKPNASTWSIAQNIDHIMVINSTYIPVIDAIRNGTYQFPFIGKVGFIVNFFGKMILDSVSPDRKRKMKTFAIWEPASSQIDADILQKFKQHQAELKLLIASCNGLLDKGTVISSPANKNIVYKLETAFDIIVTHERRHLEQARGVFSMLG
jgi:hypothetical protein